jgi:hypothetical protein
MERVITKKIYLMNKRGAKCRIFFFGNSGIALWDQRRFLNLLTFRLKSVDQIRFWEDKQLGTQH